MGATVQKLEAPVISCDGCSLPMNVSCDVPEDQVGGVGVTWEPQGRLWGAEETLSFHKSIGREREAPFGEAVVGIF